ncbi:MAG TPA: lipid-A-disaccharide synthase N-terminal domain-containing protein, partial [Planctomycetota bacterium]|nr:lipid-A-disaccharide synthase N-terminal domain-containing protein [Planctomycetota bacterium]
MTFWAALGWLGNVGFFSRFFVQWLASERAGRSVAPQAFWWLS